MQSDCIGNSVDPDQLASSKVMVWIYTVFKSNIHVPSFFNTDNVIICALLLQFYFSRFWEIPFAYTHDLEIDFNKKPTDIIWLHKDGADGKTTQVVCSFS